MKSQTFELGTTGVICFYGSRRQAAEEVVGDLISVLKNVRGPIGPYLMTFSGGSVNTVLGGLPASMPDVPLSVRKSIWVSNSDAFAGTEARPLTNGAEIDAGWLTKAIRKGHINPLQVRHLGFAPMQADDNTSNANKIVSKLGGIKALTCGVGEDGHIGGLLSTMGKKSLWSGTGKAYAWDTQDPVKKHPAARLTLTCAGICRIPFVQVVILGDHKAEVARRFYELMTTEHDVSVREFPMLVLKQVAENGGKVTVYSDQPFTD